MQNIIDSLKGLVCARYPLISLVSTEEDRVQKAVAELARQLKKRLYVWTSTEGLRDVDTGVSADGDTQLSAPAPASPASR